MDAAITVAWFLAGAAIEVLNTLSRRWTVGRLGQVSAVGWIVAGFVLRLAGTAGVLVLAFRQGVWRGAAALVGYMAARWAAVVWLNRQLGRAGSGS